MSLGEAAHENAPPAVVNRLFRLMSDAALVVDLKSLEVQDVNVAGAALLRAHEGEIVGRGLDELLVGYPPRCEWGLNSPENASSFECWLFNVEDSRSSICASAIVEESDPDRAILLLKPQSKETSHLANVLFEEAQAVAGVGWWSWSAETQSLFCSSAMLNLFEVPESERANVSMSTLRQRVVEEDHEAIQSCWHRATQLGQTTGSEYRVRLANGDLRYLQSSARPIEFYESGVPRLVVGMVRDVTVFARNRELEKSRLFELEKLCEVLAAADGFVWEWCLQTQLFEYVSPEAEKVLGYPASDWIGVPGFFGRIILEEDREQVLTFCANRTALGLDHTMEYRMLDARGELHWIRDHCFVKRDEQGRATHLQGLMIDITEKIRASELLRMGDERYQRLFYESPISLWECDCSETKAALNEIVASGVNDVEAWLLDHPQRAIEIANLIRVVDVNRGTLSMFEAESSADFLSNVGGIFREESLPPYIGWLASLARGDASYDFENVLYSLKTGKRMICSIRSRVARGSEKSYSRIYSAVDNITDRKSTEQLQTAHRRVLELIAARRPLSQVAEALLGEIELLSPYLLATLVLPGWSDESQAEYYSGGRYERQIRSSLGDVNYAYLPGASAVLGELALHDLRHPTGVSREEQSVAATAVRHALINCGVNRCAAVRVGSSDEGCIGLLLVMSSSSEFPDSLLTMVRSFADLAGVALEHAQAVGELMLRTAELQSVFGAYPDVLLRVNPNGDLIEAFGATYMQRLMGPEVNNAATLWDAVSEETAARFQDAMALVALGSRVEGVEFSVTRDGKRHSLEARFVSLPDSHEQMVVIRDITRLKETEAALLHANHQFQRLFDQSPDAIFVETFGGVVLDANRAACELHQMEREELIGRHVFDLVPEDERDRVVRTTATMANEGVFEFDGSSLRKDGQIVPISGRASKIEYGGRPALLIHVRDVSEQRKQLLVKQEQDRRMAHVSRLTMMGQLVAGIAHEIRQPLWSTNTFADVCLELLNQPNAHENIDRVRDLTMKLSAAARRASEITTRMLSFARKGQPERTIENLGKLIVSAGELAAPRLRSSNVSLRIGPVENLPDLYCDRVLIEQTIVNLLNNACQALLSKEHGTREIEVNAAVDDHEAVIRVADNGPGLPSGVGVEQLFESFFTTEKSGTGIGLALSRSFVEEHGGRIQAKINSSGGMTFEFTLKLTGEVQANAVRNSLHRG